MATQVVFQERRTALNQLVRNWDRRLRIQQVSLWLPRALITGLAFGVLIAIISRLRPWLVSEQIVVATLVLVVLAVVGMLLAVWLWPRPALQAARSFDVLFGLQERVSTALELIDGQIRADDELLSLQIDDAWSRARQVQPGQSLPLIWRWREWVVAGILIIVLAVLILLPNPQAEAIEQTSAQQAAIDEAKDEVAQIIQNVASDPALSEEERQELLEALAASMDTLEQPDVTAEEAFATLSDAQTALQEQADRLNDRASAQEEALQAASDALQELPNQSEVPTPEPGAEGQQPAPIPSLNNLAQNLSNMTPEQMQQAAQSLDQAAQALQETNPQAAQAMQQAAQAMREGDTQAAQEALQQASQALQQDAQQTQSQQSASQNLSDSAEQVQQAANQVGQQGNSGEQSQQGQNGEQQDENGNPSEQQQGEGSGEQQSQQSQQQEGQQGTGEQEGQQDGQEGQQGGQSSQEGEGDNASSQESQSGQSGGQEGQQSLNSEGGGQQGNQNGEGQQGQASSDGAGSGAGDTPGGAGSEESGGEAQTSGAPQNNNPDGQGQGQFEPVYAPQRPGGEGGPEIELDPNSSDAPVQEGEFSQNPSGNASVPYNQVFSDYSDAANRALESDYIPLGLRDVVRDYFSSLEPGR